MHGQKTITKFTETSYRILLGIRIKTKSKPYNEYHCFGMLGCVKWEAGNVGSLVTL